VYLIDTNIFLEILLGQEKKDSCKKFLSENSESIYISDFSLHSIGVILLKTKKIQTFQIFLDKFLPDITLLSLPKDKYYQLTSNSQNLLLDFDDSYQFTLAKFYGFHLVSIDKHFKKITEIKTIII